MKETNTPQQVLQRAREEFEKKWKRLWLHDGNLPVENYTSCEEEILSWHTTTIKAFIEAEIERLEGMKKEKSIEWRNGIVPSDGLSPTEAFTNTGFNSAIQDQITHLKELST